MQWIVNDPFGFATNLNEFAGSNLTLKNDSTTDVYYDVMAAGAQLNGSAPGTIPTGTKLANGGGTIQFFNAPRDLWVRSATQTTLSVQAEAPRAEPAPARRQTVLAGVTPLTANSLVRRRPL